MHLEILRTATMDLSYTDSMDKGLIAVGHLVPSLRFGRVIHPVKTVLKNSITSKSTIS